MHWHERISVNAADSRAPAADLAFKSGENVCCGQLSPSPLQAIGHPADSIQGCLQEGLWGIDVTFIPHTRQIEVEQ
jgi:hypothetical protein